VHVTRPPQRFRQVAAVLLAHGGDECGISEDRPQILGTHLPVPDVVGVSGDAIARSAHAPDQARQPGGLVREVDVYVIDPGPAQLVV
jgi:hypothetical protein